MDTILRLTEQELLTITDALESMIVKQNEVLECIDDAETREEITNDIDNTTSMLDSINHQSKQMRIAIIWSEDDVRCMNKDENGENEYSDDFKGTELTDEQVKDVLTSLERRHDNNYGICWDTIIDTLAFH